jgi:hypothetical protein
MDYCSSAVTISIVPVEASAFTTNGRVVKKNNKYPGDECTNFETPLIMSKSINDHNNFKITWNL